MLNNTFQFIKTHKIFAVIRNSNKDRALKSAYALLEGGIKIIEISMLSSDAVNTINKLQKDGVFVGAGTVMNEKMANQVVDAGARYIVSPHIDENIIRTAINNNIYVSSGCVTPNEIVRANNLGVNLIKIFPANGFGGVTFLKSLIEIFPEINFMPTGGVNMDNINEYFNVGVTAVGMSSSLIPKSLVDNEMYDDIKTLAHRYISILKT